MKTERQQSILEYGFDHPIESHSITNYGCLTELEVHWLLQGFNQHINDELIRLLAGGFGGPEDAENSGIIYEDDTRIATYAGPVWRFLITQAEVVDELADRSDEPISSYRENAINSVLATHERQAFELSGRSENVKGFIVAKKRD
jgi:hypothetical protein